MAIYPSSDELISNFNSRVSAAESLVDTNQFELIGTARIEGRKIELPIEMVASVEPAEEPGRFIMHLKEEIADNKGKLIITGATLLAFGALAVRARHRHKSS